jgi:hypothetical protein
MVRSVACFRSVVEDGQRVSQFSLTDLYNYSNPWPQFEAVETLNGWAFRAVHTDRYLGIPLSIAPPDHRPRLSSVPIEFSWLVHPHYEDRKRFRCAASCFLITVQEQLATGSGFPSRESSWIFTWDSARTTHRFTSWRIKKWIVSGGDLRKVSISYIAMRYRIHLCV